MQPSEAGGAHHPVPLPLRTLTWDGCANVRDLGAIPTAGGPPTRVGRIIRADSAHRLSEAGLAALVDYGIRRIVDLRLSSELARDPLRRLTIDVIHVPVLPEWDSPEWTAIASARDNAGDAGEATRNVYLEILDRCQARLAIAVETLGSAARAGGVMVQCDGGKDRTGLVSALLLRLAGVPIAGIAADYALSSAGLRERTAAFLARAVDDADRRRREWTSAAPARAMAEVLAALERRHGSVRAYLIAGGAYGARLDEIGAAMLT